MDIIINEYINYLINWLKIKVKLANAEGVIFGLSGGIDSSVVALLAKKAFPKNHLALILPVKEDNLDYKLASKLVIDKKIINKKININEIANTFFNKAEIIENKFIRGNSFARIRMTTLYSYAQMNNYLVLGTDNACEWHIGYFTKFGDGAADLFPIIHLLKSEVRKMGKLLGVDRNVIDRDPTASLWENQTDEKELGFTYFELDNYLSKKNNINKKSEEKIINLHIKSDHKRNKIIKPKNLKEFKIK